MFHCFVDSLTRQGPAIVNARVTPRQLSSTIDKRENTIERY